MVITGEIEKAGAHWAASVDPLGAHAVGRTRIAAHAALAATILEYAADYGPLGGWKVDIADDGQNTLYVSSVDPIRLMSLLIRRQRDLAGMSLSEVAKATGAKSRNGWAQYEQGQIEPRPSTLQNMLDAVDSELIVAIIPRTARVIPRHDEAGDDAAEIDQLLESPTPKAAAALRAKHAARGSKSLRNGARAAR